MKGQEKSRCALAGGDEPTLLHLGADVGIAWGSTEIDHLMRSELEIHLAPVEPAPDVLPESLGGPAPAAPTHS